MKSDISVFVTNINQLFTQHNTTTSANFGSLIRRYEKIYTARHRRGRGWGIPNGVRILIEYDPVKGIRTLQCNQIFNSN